MSAHTSKLMPLVAGVLIGTLAAKAAAQTAPPPAAATAPKPKPTATAKPPAAPAAGTAAPTQPAAQPDTQQAVANPGDTFQTLEQLNKAGVRRCLQVAQAVGQATITGSSQYAAASTWNTKQPDNRFSVSMIGQRFAPGQNSMANGNTSAGVGERPNARRPRRCAPTAECSQCAGHADARGQQQLRTGCAEHSLYGMTINWC
jgi:hypothetical protein